MLVIFSLKNAKQDHKLELAYLYVCRIIEKWPEMLLILGRSGTQYVAMVTKILSHIVLHF